MPEPHVYTMAHSPEGQFPLLSPHKDTLTLPSNSNHTRAACPSHLQLRSASVALEHPRFCQLFAYGTTVSTFPSAELPHAFHMVAVQ